MRMRVQGRGGGGGGARSEEEERGMGEERRTTTATTRGEEEEVGEGFITKRKGRGAYTKEEEPHAVKAWGPS